MGSYYGPYCSLYILYAGCMSFRSTLISVVHNQGVDVFGYVFVRSEVVLRSLHHPDWRVSVTEKSCGCRNPEFRTNETEAWAARLGKSSACVEKRGLSCTAGPVAKTALSVHSMSGRRMRQNLIVCRGFRWNFVALEASAPVLCFVVPKVHRPHAVSIRLPKDSKLHCLYILICICVYASMSHIYTCVYTYRHTIDLYVFCATHSPTTRFCLTVI